MPGFELIDKEELAEIVELFEKSRILFRHGFDQQRNGVYKVREFEQAFAKYMGQQDALAVTSGTAALKVILKAFGIGKGDEVITQAFTFVATPEAIIECGAQPVIADIDATLNMNAASLEAAITAKTKAIIVVHMLGVPANMNAIMAVAKKHGLKVIEDTAWGCGGKYHGQHLGTIGDAGTFSFDFAKTMTTGEGGMVLCKDLAVLERAKAYHDHGHENNPALPRWEDSRSGSGFNYRMMELQGAVGLAQLKKLDYVIQKQRENKEEIRAAIKDLPIKFREAPEDFLDTSDALVIRVENNVLARSCRDSLLSNGVGTKILPEAISWHFAGTWNHMPELMSYYNNDLEKAFVKSRQILDQAVSIPISIYMKPQIAKLVRDALLNVL